MTFPEGCLQLGCGLSEPRIKAFLRSWCTGELDCLLVLAATRTAEHEGISAAGATAASRRFTALADAELLLRGPGGQRRWSLPPLPAGVSPALLSHVAAKYLKLQPQVAALGLEQQPDFPHLRMEPANQGPSDCLSSGRAMPALRVRRLWQQGVRVGSRLNRPLLLAECVPGGTTTAQAVLTALGVGVADWVSGSARLPPRDLKHALVRSGLAQADLGESPGTEAVLAAVGDPFQAFAAGLLVGTVHSRQPVLLAGGSQMLAVLALSLQALPPSEQCRLTSQVLLGTTAWLAQEQSPAGSGSSLARLVNAVGEHFDRPLAAVASGVRFHNSDQQQLRDYEDGHVKEGVGAGGLLLLAQLRGAGRQELVADCGRAVQQLFSPSVRSGS